MKPVDFARLRRRSFQAFTLLEVLTVVTIIVLLLALMTPPLMSVLDANRLTESGQSLLYRISQAKQMALTSNRPVELRFFKYADDNGVEGFHAAQLFFYDQEANKLEPIESPVYFNIGVMIPDSPIAPLLASGADPSADVLRAEREPFRSRDAEYRKIIFYPNGSTSIAAPLREAYVTLCSTRTDIADAATPPSNYYTIQVDPINGSTKAYRPD